MDYKTKVKYAEKVATQLQAKTRVEVIRTNLLEEGLYESDIDKIIISAKKVLGDQYLPTIKQNLKDGLDPNQSSELKVLDQEIIDGLIEKARKALAAEEKQKITKLMKEGVPAEEVFQQVDTRFFQSEKAVEHLRRLQDIKEENSGSGRLFNIFGGIGLIVLTGVILVTADRLFYVLPIIGIVMIVKGITTTKME